MSHLTFLAGHVLRLVTVSVSNNYPKDIVYCLIELTKLTIRSLYAVISVIYLIIADVRSAL